MQPPANPQNSESKAPAFGAVAMPFDMFFSGESGVKNKKKRGTWWFYDGCYGDFMGINGGVMVIPWDLMLMSLEIYGDSQGWKQHNWKYQSHWPNTRMIINMLFYSWNIIYSTMFEIQEV